MIKLKYFNMKVIACIGVVILIFGTVDSKLSVNKQSEVALKATLIITEKPKNREEHDLENVSVIKSIEPIKRSVEINPLIQNKLLEQKKPKVGLFKTSLAAVQNEGKVTLDFILENVSGEKQQINYGSGQQYDIWVFNESGEEVYKWSINKAFTLALITRELGKTEQLKFNEVWNLTNSQDIPVPTGNYTIEVKIMIGSEAGTLDQAMLTAKSTIEIT